MNNVIKVWKKVGETPLEVIDRLRQEKPEYKDQKITYAGRLDPLAEGELMLLVGNAVHKKEQYLKKDKEYEVDIVLGIRTDTFDGLGLVLEEGGVRVNFEEKIEAFIENNIGEIGQKYPPFSSKTVGGTPLFELTKKGIEFEIPTHTVNIYTHRVRHYGLINREDLKEEIQRKNSLVKGDFRQDEIKERWNDYFGQTDYTQYPVIRIKMKVSSGFYVRQFADDLGNYLKCGAFALHIKRTNIFNI